LNRCIIVADERMDSKENLAVMRCFWGYGFLENGIYQEKWRGLEKSVIRY
jgi:hypothetical protein